MRRASGDPPARAEDVARVQPTPPAPARPDVAAGALRILALQTSIGNAATSRLLQRDPVGGLATPESPIHPQQEREPGWSLNQYEGDDQVSLPKEQAEALPPDVARKVLAAQATLGKMTPLQGKDRAMLGKALAGSRIAELVTTREQYRDGIKTTEAQIGSLMPPAGQPDDSVAYQIHSLGQFLETQRLKVEGFQAEIDEQVRLSGCATENELLTLVREDFPKLFIQRGKEIASQQLWDNQTLIETEMARYGISENPLAGTIHEEIHGGVDPYVIKTAKKEEAEGLRTAAKELLGLRQAREAAESNRKYFSHMEDEWEAAQKDPDGDFDGSKAVMAATEAEQQAFERLVLQFPMLYRVDVETTAKASDEELTQEVYGKALELLGNIGETRSNLWDGKLEVWNLKDIVELTLIDLAIPEGSPLVAVVDNYVREAKADSGILSKALIALQIAAAIVAIVATGGTALIAAGIGAAISVSQIISATRDYKMETAASNVALDPSVADISRNEPRLMPIVFAVLSLGLDAIGVGQALKALRAPARALLESGDLAAFSATAYKALPAAEADRLVLRLSSLPEVSTVKAAVGQAPRGTGFTGEQIRTLFQRAFGGAGPPDGTIIVYRSEAAYEAARTAAGLPPNTAGFFNSTGDVLQRMDDVAALGTVHLPPTASTLTAMHEALHMFGARSGVDKLLGRYVEEGLTEWIARTTFGPETGRFIYEGNLAFVQLLAREVGEDTLRAAYLNANWGPLRSALANRLGGQAPVNHFYELLRRVGPNGERGGALDEATDMLFPASANP